MKTNDLQENSKEKIINDYEKIINYVLKNMRLSYRRDELFDIGLIGFTRGINTYDETKEVKCITYICDCIKNEFKRYLEYENCKKRKVEMVSLNSFVKDEHNKPIDELQSLIGYEVDYLQDNYIDELLMLIEKRSVDFTNKQWIIFNHLYGMNGFKELTAKEISEKYGFSKQSIYQMNKKIINILRNSLLKYKSYDNKYEKHNLRKIGGI